MSSTKTTVRAARPAIGFFERYLTVWVALCIVGGILLGQLLPPLFQAIGRMEVAEVNLPVGVLIWVMIVPMLVKIDFAAMTRVKSQWRGIGVTLFINWFVKPFSMALLGWIFIRHVFAPWLPADRLDSYIAGLILLAAAPCTAMVFVWSQLCKGDPYFTLSQVALNDSIMIVAFAPLVALLLGLSAITVPWDTLIISVGLYIVIPVIFACVKITICWTSSIVPVVLFAGTASASRTQHGSSVAAIEAPSELAVMRRKSRRGAADSRLFSWAGDTDPPDNFR